MPATSGTFAIYETEIFNELISQGLNTAAVCGVLANLELESGFNPRNLQDGFENSLGYDDKSYTIAVDNGTYKNFVGDSAGYGLAQWTYSTRKRALYEFATKTKKTSIGNLSTQVNFLVRELQGTTWYSDFKKVWTMLASIENTAQGAYDAGYNFCRDFENPAGGTRVYQYRGEQARDKYWKYYSSGAKETAKAVENLGKKIVEIAQSAVGLDYIPYANMYDSQNKGADAAGLVYYSYTEAGVEVPDTTVQGYYNYYQGKARVVDLSGVSAADLLFYGRDMTSSTDLNSIAIANGSGGRIYAKNTSEGIVEEEGLGNPTHILRILSNAETSSDTSEQISSVVGEGFASISPDSYASLTSIDPNAATIAQNLSRMTTEGFDYGYLIDMTNGGEFRFYIPEFSEQAGAQWSPIDIRGRSVTVQSYSSTSSRNISVSLDLYAGAGLYAAQSEETGEDTVSRLHRDAYFVKSLEYPDYTNAIARPPATVHLILGSAVNIVGVVSNVVVEHLKPLDAQNRAMYLKLSFTVTQTAVNPPDWTDIRKGQNSIASTGDPGSMYDGGTTIYDVNPVYTHSKEAGGLG